jgi:hypothetical protein
VRSFKAIPEAGHDHVVTDYWPVTPRKPPYFWALRLGVSNRLEGFQQRLVGPIDEDPFCRNCERCKRA